jgi:uncharacterized protein YndB with AHSA1/START domain
MEKICISAIINANQQKVWDYYTLPEHITKWNFASADWCCPSASNDLQVGGIYIARMEAKDGSFGFDFEVSYTEVNLGNSFTYTGMGRYFEVTFTAQGEATRISICFDPETQNPVELQQQGWQAILNNFKSYTETH